MMWSSRKVAFVFTVLFSMGVFYACLHVPPQTWRDTLPLLWSMNPDTEFGIDFRTLYMEETNGSINVTYINYFTSSQREADLKMKQKDSNGTYYISPVDTCTQEERKQLLQFQCRETKQPRMSERYFRHLFVDQKHKLVVCIPPKSGCTTWKAILANNSRDKPLSWLFDPMTLHNKLEKYKIMQLNKLKPAERKTILNSTEYTKVLTTRHPFERVYSAYVDKLQSGKDKNMRKIHGGRILNKFHPELPEKVRKVGAGVTFKEFIDYIKLPMSNSLSYQHWDAVSDVCQPCHIHYDYIIKTETMTEDNAPVIEKHLGPYHRGIGTAGNVMSRGSKDKQRTATLTVYGRALSAYSSLNQTDIAYLVDRFTNDFRYFGYSSAIVNDSKVSVGLMHNSCSHGSLNKQCC